MGLDPGEEGGPNPRHSIQPREVTKRAPARAILHDPLGKDGTDPGQPGEIQGRRAIGVDPLIRGQRSGSPFHQGTLGLQGAGGSCREKADRSGGLLGPAERQSSQVTQDRQSEQQEDQAALGESHEKRIPPPQEDGGVISSR